MKAMLLAAGLGTRLQPLTDTKPKALVEIGGTPMLELAIRYLKKHGVDDLVINVHHFADQIEDFMIRHKGFGMKFRFADEREALLDTGGAILKARHLLEDEPEFILMGVDILTDLDLGSMIRFHQTHTPLATLAVKDRETSRSLLFDRKMKLVGWRNNRTGEVKGLSGGSFEFDLGFSVIHVLSNRIFNLIEERGAFPIMDLYLRLMEAHEILGFRHDGSGWMEFGRAAELDKQVRSDEFHKLIRSL